MLFNEFALCHYLIENGFLNHDLLVNQQIRITRHFSRNRNFILTINDLDGFFIKQPRLSFYLSNHALKREADLCWLVQNDADFSALKKHMPHFHHYDAETQVLISGLVPSSTSLFDYHTLSNDYPENFAILQAEILATLHQISFSKIENKKSASLFPKKSNWLFNIESDDGWWGGRKTESELKLKNIVTSSVDLLQCVTSAKKKWNMQCLLHNDIRWSNFLIEKNSSANEKIKLLDWELADFGDPCWDIAGILQSYFSHWVINKAADPFQLLKMKPALLKFIETYSDLMQLQESEKKIFAHKSMEYCGVRLLQSCIEHVTHHNILEQKTLRLLQFALNILKNPELAYQDFIEAKKISA